LSDVFIGPFEPSVNVGEIRGHDLTLEEHGEGGDQTHGQTPYEASPDGAR
jgi:hypothetical protein